jgi:hypothetical protein
MEELINTLAFTIIGALIGASILIVITIIIDNNLNKD